MACHYGSAAEAVRDCGAASWHASVAGAHITDTSVAITRPSM